MKSELQILDDKYDKNIKLNYLTEFVRFGYKLIFLLRQFIILHI